MESGQFDAAFKNLCCCLSVGHLLVGKKANDPSSVEKAIEFCFNNKEARALRCLQKLKEGKKIEALNQINYALYLDPSHPLLLTIQKRVYQEIGMKELKPLAKGPQRPRFEKLETCKEIPAADIIQT
jgi:Tfp pilus assembly protein PilF